MASELVMAVPDLLMARRTPSERITTFLVRRRVLLTFAIFTSLVLVDMFVLGRPPRDILNPADPLVVASELLILAGLALRSWAAGTLRKRRELATTGAYAWIRNPLYAGSFLMMVGFCTLVGDPFSLWFTAGPIAWLYWQAVQAEEGHLARIFEEQWPDYATRVPRFVPRRFVWSPGSWSVGQWLANSEYQAWIGSGVALLGIKLWQVWS
jgi:protein-S-isoprenylcysteine O-methyltransferase Ste14